MNELEWINSRLDEGKDWISDLEDKKTVSTQGEQQKENIIKKWRKSKEPVGQHQE